MALSSSVLHAVARFLLRSPGGSSWPMGLHTIAVASMSMLLDLQSQGAGLDDALDQEPVNEIARKAAGVGGQGFRTLDPWDTGPGDSMFESFLPLVLLVAVIALAARLIAGGFDGDRVEAYVRKRGWELVDRSWDPFGPGWFGEQDSRIYQIVDRDERGDVHRAHVKTSMYSGVYLTNDEIVERAAPDTSAVEVSDLEKENARLRERIAELEAEEQ